MPNIATDKKITRIICIVLASWFVLASIASIIFFTREMPSGYKQSVETNLRSIAIADTANLTKNMEVYVTKNTIKYDLPDFFCIQNPCVTYDTASGNFNWVKNSSIVVILLSLLLALFSTALLFAAFTILVVSSAFLHFTLQAIRERINHK